jgi:hypothetical protein
MTLASHSVRDAVLLRIQMLALTSRRALVLARLSALDRVLELLHQLDKSQRGSAAGRCAKEKGLRSR